MWFLSIDTSASLASVSFGSDSLQEISEIFKNQARHHDTILFGMIQEAFSRAGVPLPSSPFVSKEDSFPALISVSKGPGAFTGLRVGLSCALGLSSGWNVPVVGINTLLALFIQARLFHTSEPTKNLSLESFETKPLPEARFKLSPSTSSSDPPKRLYLTHLHTRREESYGQLWEESGRPLSPPSAFLKENALEEISAHYPEHELFLAGDDDRLNDFFQAHHPRATVLFSHAVYATSLLKATKRLISLDKKGILEGKYHPNEPLYLRPPLTTPPKKQLSPLSRG